MSFVFTVKTPVRVPPAAMLELLGGADLRAHVDGDRVFVHRELVSTRSIGIVRDEAGYDVRVNVLSSSEDWELARRAVEALHELTEGELSSELADSFARGELRALHDDELVAQQNESGTRGLFALMRHRDEPGSVSIPGVVRSLEVGPRLASALDHLEDHARAARLVAILHRLQWVEEREGCRAANVLLVSREGSEKRKLVVWPLGEKVFLPASEQVAVIDDATRTPFVFPRAALVELAPEIEILDEEQAIVEPVRDPAPVIARARELATT